jgi:hypothetical protein
MHLGDRDKVSLISWKRMEAGGSRDIRVCIALNCQRKFNAIGPPIAGARLSLVFAAVSRVLC